MEGNAVTLTEDANVESREMTIETEVATFEAGVAIFESGDGALENGDVLENGDAIDTGGLSLETGAEAFESGDMPDETGNFTEENGSIDAEAGNSEAVKLELPTETGAENVEKRWPGWPGESVFRILIPAQKVGGLIGRKGELIKRMCDETKARIKVVDAPKGSPERAVIISAKEEPDASLPPAIDALLRVHKRIIDDLGGDSAQLPPSSSNIGPTRLLVPAAQAGFLIGKQGATIKSIQEGSGSVVRVVEKLPPMALQDDRVVEIMGEPIGTHKALELIANYLRKFLVDRSILPLFEMQMMPNMHLEHNMTQSWGLTHGLPPTGGSSGYGGSPQFMPPRSHENFYPSTDFSQSENLSHRGISMYGQNAPAPRTYAPSMVSQITHQMQIPLLYADAVIGAAGVNISYIRRASGATITIQESRTVPGDMTVEIGGTNSQVQIAEQLIQNFMAEAAAPASAPNLMGAANQSYNYAEHRQPVYGSPSNVVESVHVDSGYGSSYGTNYGY